MKSLVGLLTMHSLVGLPSMHSRSGTMHSLTMGYAKFSRFADYAQSSQEPCTV